MSTTEKKLAIVRGGGDLGTGVIYRLWRAHFKVLVLEIERPLVVRINVSAANAIFCGETEIEGMRIKRIDSPAAFNRKSDDIEIIVSPGVELIEKLRPQVLIDAIMAKRNTGTVKDMTPIVIGVGPGFTAPEDVHAVVETKRGHYLGRAIYNGTAIANTGIPGIIKGYGTERLLRAPAEGYVTPICAIGDTVVKGETIAHIRDLPVSAQIDGVLRGLIHPSVFVRSGTKIGDIDPSGEKEHCWTITDKALAIGGGVLEAIAYLSGQ